MDMRQFGTRFKSATFDKEFKVLFSKIYPSFEVASDEAITKDLKLLKAYNILWMEYNEAKRRHRFDRRDRRNS
jgi:hypothetical protein